MSSNRASKFESPSNEPPFSTMWQEQALPKASQVIKATKFIDQDKTKYIKRPISRRQTPLINKYRNELLAKAEEYKIPVDYAKKLNFIAIYHMIKEHEFELNQLAIRMLQEEVQYDGIEKELITKAVEYNIPYNAADINWHELEDNISEVEALIAEGEQYNIGWKPDWREIVEMRQQLEYHERKSVEEQNSLRQDYYDSIRVY